jgi:hypothetical protein
MEQPDPNKKKKKGDGGEGKSNLWQNLNPFDEFVKSGRFDDILRGTFVSPYF